MSAKAPSTLVLTRMLDVRGAQPLVDDLLVMRGRPVSVDASQVERLGGLCLQVLLSAAATWRADGVRLQVCDPSDSFQDQLSDFGLTLPDLSSPEPIP